MLCYSTQYLIWCFVNFSFALLGSGQLFVESASAERADHLPRPVHGELQELFAQGHRGRANHRGGGGEPRPAVDWWSCFRVRNISFKLF